MVNVEFDVDYAKKRSYAKCPEKSMAVLTVSPAAGGFIFYKVTADVGGVASELAGNFTSIDIANKAIQQYYNNCRQTVASSDAEVKKRLAKGRAKANATTTNSKASDDLHKGSSN